MILKRGQRRENDRERNIDWLPLMHSLIWDRNHKLGMCPDQESNLRLFNLPGDTLTNGATLAQARGAFLE